MHPTIDISTPSSTRFLTSIIHHLKILIGLVLVFFQAWLAGGPAIRESLTPIPHFSDSLWLAHKDRLLKIDLSEGDLLLVIPTVKDLRALAVDNRRGLVWAYGKKQLFAFAFDGELRLSIPVSVADTAGPKQDHKRHLDLEVNSNSGTVWLGLSRSLCQFDAAGELLNVLPLPEKVEALALDPVTDLLWVATRRMLLSYEESGGPVQVLELAERTNIEDLAIDTPSGDLWVLGKNRLSRVQANGTRLFASKIKNPSRLVTDHRGGVWLTRNKELLRVDPSGATLFEVKPLDKKLEMLASDPLDGSVWVGSRRQLAQVSSDGQVLRRLQSVSQEKLHLRDLALYVDVIAPEIAFLAPRNGDLLSDSTPNIELSLGETGAGVDLASLDLQVDDRKLPASCSLDGTRVDCTPTVPLPNGLLQLSASLKDFNGNQSEQALVSFTLDTIPPRLNFTAPSEGDTIETATPVVEIRFHDSGSGVDPQTLQVQANGTELAASCTFDTGRASCAPETRLVEGVNTLTATIEDQAGNLSSIARVSFTVLTTGAPDLSPIGDKVVAVGSRLTINLTAVDPEMDPLTFSASPVPLLENASLNSLTGVFTFIPALRQAGVLALTFIVSDGVLTASETINITVNGPPAGGVTELTGRILDTNDFVLGTQTPVVGATVSLLETGVSTRSDSNGNFSLTGIPSGSQILDIDTTTADPAPDGSSYAAFREELELIANVTNVVDRPFFLPRIDSGSLTTVHPDSHTVVSNPRLPATLTIPPATARNPDGTNFAGQISISEVPEGLAPASLPERLDPGLLVTIQPVGVTFATPVPLTLPNTDHLFPGSATDLWSLEPETGTFQVVGTGRVSAAGTVIETVSGGVRAADWHFMLPPQPREDGSDNNAVNQDQSKCADCSTGSSTALASGNLTVHHDLVSYRSMGQSRNLRLVYKSLNADPQPIIVSRTTIPVRAALPGSLSTQLSVAGIDQAVRYFTDTQGLDEDLDETIRQAVQFDASSYATGSYPYRLTLRSHYRVSSVAALQEGGVLVNNKIESPYGAGWTVDGVDRLSFPTDGRTVVWDEGEGGIRVYPEVPFAVGSFDSARGGIGSLEFAQQLQSTRDALTTNFAGLEISSFESLTSQALAEVDILVLSAAKTGFEGINPLTSAERTELLNFVRNGGCAILVTENDFQFGPASESLIDPFGMDSAGQVIGTVTATVSDPMASPVTSGPFGTILSFSQNFPSGITDLGSFATSLATNVIGHALAVIEEDGINLGSGRVVVHTDFDTLSVVDSTHQALFLNTIQYCQDNLGSPTNRFQSPPGDFSSLVRNPDGSHTRTLKNGTRINLDSDGLQTSIVDRNGNTTSFAYDADDRLTSVTDPVGLVTTLFYSGGLLTSIVDPANRLTQFGHDGAGNLTTITDPDGLSRSFGYDSRHRLISQVSKRGFQTTYTYDFAGRNVGVMRADGSTREIAPGALVGLVDPKSGSGSEANPTPFVRPQDVQGTFTDGNNNTTTFTTDAFGAATAASDALNRTTLITRDENSNPTDITRANGAVTTMTYDPRGNLLTATEHAIGATTSFSYEASFNQLTSITDPEGNSTTIHYDASGNPIEIIDALGTRTTMAYADPNCSGQLTSVTAAVGVPEENTTTFHYDPITCNLSQTIDPLLSTTTLAYNHAGNVVQSTDAEGRTTRFQYDGLNRSTKVIDATILPPTDPPCTSAGVTCYQYDDNGNLTQVTDARGNMTIFEYDSEDRLIKTTDPLGNFETFIHDNNGNLLSTTDRNGQTIDFQYDVVNQLVQKTLLAGKLEETITMFAYDSVGNLTSVTDPDSALTMTYDPLSRLASVSTSSSSNQPDVLIDHTYDKNGNRLTITDPTGLTRYHYDPLNRPTNLTNPSVQTTSFDYDALSRRIQLSLPNGVTTSYGYDDAGQLLNLIHQLAASTISDFFYTYDKVGNRTSLTQQRPSVAANPLLEFSYDQLNRLVVATHPLPADPLETFDYDTVGNRRLRDGEMFSATFDAANRLLEDQDSCYNYDLNGNLRSKEAKVAGLCSGAGQLTEYDYDPENQLTEVRVNGTPVGSYRYDGLGRRIEKNAGGTITQYVYDNEDILLEFDVNAVPEPVEVVYDLDADWSDAVNPSGPWAYNSEPGTPIAMHVNDWDSDFSGPQPAWATAPGAVPVWFKTVSPAVPTGPTDLPVGTIGAHASNTGNPGISWTAPVDGDVSVSGGIWLARKTLGRSMDWTLKVNGVPTTSGNVNSGDSFTSSNPFDLVNGSGGPSALTFSLLVGDVVDLELVKAPASPFSEFVGLNLTITQTVSTVPPLARYTHGPGIDEPLIMERDLDSSGTFDDDERFYYQVDGLGSVTGLTDSEGVVAQIYLYDSFGQIVQQLGTLANPYTYTGREFDEETGLYYYRARYYHPDNGRFTTEDPIAFLGGINFYVMTQNSPTNWVDPWGLWRTAGHRILTTAAMKRAGFSTLDIDIANKANRSVDNVTNWFNDPQHYMPGTGALAEAFIEQKLNESVEKALAGDRQGALEALGKGLHPVQDKWSHQMQNAGWMAHNPLGQNADSVKNHIAEYASALKDTQDYVKRFLQGIGGICAFNSKAE